MFTRFVSWWVCYVGCGRGVGVWFMRVFGVVWVAGGSIVVAFGKFVWGMGLWVAAFVSFAWLVICCLWLV